MQVRGYDVGVCSWSLQPKDMADLIRKVSQLGLAHVQLGLNGLYVQDESQRARDIAILRDSGLRVTATSISFPAEDFSSLPVIRRTGGLVPDEHWQIRREMAMHSGKLTAALGVKCLEFHVGFVPSSGDPSYAVLVGRVREIAAALGADGLDLLMETGQESASELLQFFNDLNCRNVAVNFDPANMILYGAGDPIEAIAILGRHVRHVHLKDAIASDQPRMQWGREVPLGSGQVGIAALLDALDEINYEGVLSIERESGSDRAGDIRAAIHVLKDLEAAGE